jgi:hypothetical protein
MSFNLRLLATRTVTLPSGKTEEQVERPDIFWQTPTTVTNSILALSTLDAQIEAYFEWNKTIDYKMDDKIIFCEGEGDGYWTKSSFLKILEDGVLIDRVYWKGEKEFDEYVEKEWKNYPEFVKTFEGVFWISGYENHRQEVLQKIQNLKDHEFELELYYI